jgi:hypothetical protein
MTTEVVPVANPSIGIGQHRVDSLAQRLFKTIRNTFFPSISLNRLRNTFDIVDSELRMVINEANSQDNKPVARWQQRSQSLLVGAWEAYNEGNAELGWRRLKAADRFMLYGLDAVPLTIEAGSILAEANDDGKELSKWRKLKK